MDAKVTYRNAAGAVVVDGNLSAVRTFTNCTTISGYGDFCFRRTHAVEWYWDAGANTYWWRGWVRLECILNGNQTNCNFRHLKFSVWGADWRNSEQELP